MFLILVNNFTSFLKKYFLFKISSFTYFLILLVMMLHPKISTSQIQVVADFTTLTDKTGCGSLVVEFKDLSTGNPNTWLWDFGNGNTSNLQHPITVYSSPGTYSVSLTVSNQSSNDIKYMNAYIKIFEEPQANFSIVGNNMGCTPLLVIFEDNSNSNSQLVNWQWDFGDGGSSNLQNPNYEFNYEGLYTVSLSVEDINGCENLISQSNSVKVNNTPIADFEADITFSCNSSEIVRFTNNSVNAVNYFWDFGDGTTSYLASPSHNYSAGSYTVKLYAYNGICSDTLVKTTYIEIGTLLYPTFTTDVRDGCENLLVQFTDETSNNPDTWFWDFGDGNTSTLQNPTNNYLNPGLYTISLTTSISGQCVRTITYPATIEVFPKPDINFNFDNNYGCTLPVDIQFFDNTNNAVSWNWHFSNGTTLHGDDPILTINNYGVYDLSLTSVNSFGCASNKQFDSLIIIEDIDINIASNTQQGCSPLYVNFFDTSNTIVPIVDYLWDFGNGTTSNQILPNTSYLSSNFYDVKLTVTNDNGCVASKIFNEFIKVNTTPIIDFEVSSIQLCAGEDVYFNNLSSPTNLITNWLWDFGNGDTSSLFNPVYQYQTSSIYDISLIASIDGCKDSLTIVDYIEVIDPNSYFEENYNCVNPLQVNFTDLSSGADSYFWDFGDGNTSTLQNPIHQFNSRGVYNVSLNVHNNMTGCSHTFSKIVTITLPQAHFDYLINASNSYADSLGCKPHQAHLVNNSQDCAYYKVIWSDGYIGHGRTDHLIQDTGYFDVTMAIWDIHGCKDTFVYNNMYHVSEVYADFDLLNVSGCDSMIVSFENLSDDYQNVIWSFGDGITSSIDNVTHTYLDTGVYDVGLYIESDIGCKDTIYKKEFISFQFPQADFTSDKQNICDGDLVEFFDLSNGKGLTYHWDFGNGNTSNQKNPKEIFSFVNNYDITLTVTDSLGCSNTKQVSDFIKIQKPVSNFVYSNVSSNCPPLISSFIDSSSIDVVSWKWTFSDGGVSTLQNPTHLFSSSGSFDVSLEVMNSYGCKNKIIKDSIINIYGPIGTFIISDTVLCEGDTVNYEPIVQNTDYYLWDFGNGIISSDTFPEHVYQGNGSYIPSLVIQNMSGCQKTINNNNIISVNPLPTGEYFLSDSVICKGEFINFIPNVLNTDHYNWSFGDGNTSNDISPQHMFQSDGIFYCNLSLENNFGCKKNYDNKKIIVNPVPSGSYSVSKTNICQNDTVYFSPNVINTDNFTWKFGDGNISNNIFSTHKFRYSGVYTTSLIIENIFGCKDSISNANIIVDSTFIDLGNDLEICLGESIQIHAIGNLSSFLFIPSLGLSDSNVFNPIASPLVTTTYVVEHFNTLCNVKDTIEIIVHDDIPSASIFSTNHCDGDTVKFSAFSGLSNNNISWDWSFGSNIQNPSLPLGVGTHQISLTVGNLDNNCYDTVNKDIIIYPLPNAEFIANDICFGDTLFVQNHFSQDVVKWIYDMGDNKDLLYDLNPSYLYSHPGTYVPFVKVVTNHGCEDMFLDTINIKHVPNADFFSEDACVGNKTTLIDNSTVENGNIISFKWDFGDKSIEKFDSSVIHTYTNPGTYNIILNVFSDNGCSSYKLKEIEIFDLPTVKFNTLNQCIDETINFYDASISTNGLIKNWKWTLNEAHDSFYDKNISYKFNNAGLHNIRLFVEDEKGCSNRYEEKIRIYELPTVSFISDTSICLAEELLLQDNSYANYQTVNRWQWDLGDGTILNSKDIKHIYQFSGNYDIKLKVTTSQNCINQISKKSYVSVKESPVVKFKSNKSITNELDPIIEFYNNTNGNNDYYWDFGNGQKSNELNPIIEFENSGNYNVILKAISATGCVDSSISTISVYPKMTIYIPNAFTPNNDGFNDYFEVNVNSISFYEIHVYNRWGEKIFYSSNELNSWNGSDFNGTVVPNGVYLYHINIIDQNGKDWVYNGEINLLR